VSTDKVPEDPAVLAAIVVATEMCAAHHRRPSQRNRDRTPPWRFSGRWWRAPAQARRERPWVAWM
jgi:hypothetical protein